MTLVAATQRPTQKVMGQGAVRSQMNIRIAFRVQEQRDVDLVLGQGMLRVGWQAHKLNAPGKFLVSSPEHDTLRLARAYLVTDDDVTDAAARYAPACPRLDAISRLALWHLEHRLIRTPPGAGAVVLVDGRVLLMWRHRFIIDTNRWEIPVGKINPGEDPADAAARETEEETGWRPGPLRFLLRVESTPGLSDSVHHIYVAGEAEHIGPPEDDFESDRVGWVPLADLPSLIGRGEITSGTTLAALLYAIACGSAVG